jgi:hypothetical protein
LKPISELKDACHRDSPGDDRWSKSDRAIGIADTVLKYFAMGKSCLPLLLCKEWKNDFTAMTIIVMSFAAHSSRFGVGASIVNFFTSPYSFLSSKTQLTDKQISDSSEEQYCKELKYLTP